MSLVHRASAFGQEKLIRKRSAVVGRFEVEAWKLPGRGGALKSRIES